MRRFWVVHTVIPFAVWGALVLLFELTSLDLQATDRVYDFIAYDRRTPRAWLWLLPSVLLGGLFAYTQHVRGAHFLSHNVWSAGICWLVSLVVYPAFRAGPPLTSLRRPRRTIPVWRGPRRRE